MELVTKHNIEETKAFIIKHLKRSGFIYGNLEIEGSKTYIFRNYDNNIYAVTNTLGGKYLTYLFPKKTGLDDVKHVIEAMQQVQHHGGTVIGDYSNILSMYYQLPHNFMNEVASLVLESSPNLIDSDVSYLSTSDIDNYTSSLSQITEFQPKSKEDIIAQFDHSLTCALQIDGQIVSAATLNAISDKTAVITSVFTLKEHEGNGYAKKCISKLLNDYGKGRTILIFFSNPIAKQLYINLGFEVDEKLIMYNHKLGSKK